MLVLTLGMLMPLMLVTVGGATTLGGMPWWAYLIDLALWAFFILLFGFLWRWALRPVPGSNGPSDIPQQWTKLDKRAKYIIGILAFIILFILLA